MLSRHNLDTVGFAGALYAFVHAHLIRDHFKRLSTCHQRLCPAPELLHIIDLLGPVAVSPTTLAHSVTCPYILCAPSLSHWNIACFVELHHTFASVGAFWNVPKVVPQCPAVDCWSIMHCCWFTAAACAVSEELPITGSLYGCADICPAAVVPHLTKH